MFTTPKTSLDHLKSIVPADATIGVRIYRKPEKKSHSPFFMRHESKEKDSVILAEFECTIDFLEEGHVQERIKKENAVAAVFATVTLVGGEKKYLGYGDLDDATEHEVNGFRALSHALDATMFKSSANSYHLISNKLLGEEEISLWEKAVSCLADPTWLKLRGPKERGLRFVGGHPITEAFDYKEEWL